jgi:hypothetical protein
MPPDPKPEPAGRPDDRTLRLFDLAPHEVIVVRCECGRITHYGPGFLQRHRRLPSDTLIYDLQFRLRCEQCNRTAGFTITVEEQTNGAQVSKPRVVRVIVAKGD